MGGAECRMFVPILPKKTLSQLPSRLACGLPSFGTTRGGHYRDKAHSRRERPMTHWEAEKPASVKSGRRRKKAMAARAPGGPELPLVATERPPIGDRPPR